MNTIPVGVIGLGKVGFEYDDNLHESSKSISNAIFQSEKANLVFGIEPIQEKRSRFELKFQVPTFDKIYNENIASIELLVIATPTSTHREILREVIGKVPYILCEKPVTASLSQILEVAHQAQTKNCRIIVNYTRNYNMAIMETFSKFIDKEIELLTGRVLYAKGVLNNASHAIALLISLFGNVEEVTPLGNYFVDDFGQINSNFELRFMKARVIFQAVLDASLDIFEVDLFGKHARLEYQSQNSRIVLTPIISTHHEYSLLDQTSQSVIQTNENFAQLFVIDRVLQGIEGNSQILPDLDLAVHVQRIVEQILISSQKQQIEGN